MNKYTIKDAPILDTNGRIVCDGCEGCEYRPSMDKEPIALGGRSLCPRLNAQIMIHIHYADGDVQFTRFNGTPEEAVAYYSGLTLNGAVVTHLHFVYSGHYHVYMNRHISLGVRSNKEMKRVPLDFDWTLGKTWHGYHVTFCLKDDANVQLEHYCEDCKKFAKLKGLSFNDYGCPDFGFGPPVGSGFQLWDTGSCDGKPVSPVFNTLDALCEWCEPNAYIFARDRITAEQWKTFFIKK